MAADLGDYKSVVTQQKCIKDPKLSGGHIRLLPNGDPWRDTGGYCVVFKYESPHKNYAVRCWYQELSGIQERTAQIADIIRKSSLPYFVEFEYVEKGIFTMTSGIQPIIRMEWIDALNLKEYIHLKLANPAKLFELAKVFHQMCCTLHKARISHGDLQHANIKVRNNGELVLLDYDSLYHPSMGELSDYIHGKTDYQHPLRSTNRHASIYVDAFSEIVIFTSIIYYANNPNAYSNSVAESDCMLFEASDYKNITKSKGYAGLLCWSEETEFLATVIKENLLKRDLSTIDNIETIVARAKNRGIDLFNKHQYSDDELIKKAKSELQNKLPHSALIRLTYLTNKNNSEALLLLGEMYQYGKGVNRDENIAISYYKKAINDPKSKYKASRALGLIYVHSISRMNRGDQIKHVHDTNWAYSSLLSVYKTNKDAEVAYALYILHRGLYTRDEKKARQYLKEASEIDSKYLSAYNSFKSEQVRILIKGTIIPLVCGIIVVGMLIGGSIEGVSAIVSSYRYHYTEYKEYVLRGEQLASEDKYNEAIVAFNEAKSRKSNKKKIQEIDSKIADVISEKNNKAQELQGEISKIWDTYFLKNKGQISTTLNRNILKYVSKNDIKPIIESTSAKIELLNSITSDEVEYKNNTTRLNILRRYYKL